MAVCAFAAFSAPAFAGRGHEIEKHLFGKFVSSVTNKTKGHGTITAMRLGPYLFTGPELFEPYVEVENKKHEKVKERQPKRNKAGEIEYGPLCKPLSAVQEEEDLKAEDPQAAEDLKSEGHVDAGEHESLAQTLKFNKCYSQRPAGNGGGGIVEPVVASFKLGVEFFSNHSVAFGEPTSEVKIEGGTVEFKAKASFCRIQIPEQRVPVKSGTEKGENEEFESALYATEEESVAGEKAKEKKYGLVHDTLDIEAELSKIKTEVENTAQCFTKKGGPEEKVFINGKLDFEMEGVQVKNGNLSFVPAA
ncbi:MAG TPA: hypothetical protein VED41_06355 [Solirubrobacteraceae bacterium]|nr:hypothetical protein [Solirubrobacteraceae bacterium]